MNAAQCRMARAGLRWSVQNLSERSRVSASTIKRFEEGARLRGVNEGRLKEALESGGVKFLGSHGVCTPQEIAGSACAEDGGTATSLEERDPR